MEDECEGQMVIFSEGKQKCLLPALPEIRGGGQENVGSVNGTASEEPAFLKVSLGLRKPFKLSY